MAGQRQPQPQGRAVVRAQDAQRQDDGPQRALVAVTHEIDNRLAIVGASAAMGIDPQRLKLVALSAFTRTPALWTCDPVSVARSIVEAGQLGLEPTGLLGGAYLVPRRGQCTLLVGYRGLVMLAMRSQLVQRVEARVVRAKDEFDYAYGDTPYLRHKPSTERDPGDFAYAYAIIFYRDGAKQFDVMSAAEIEAIRSRSAAGNDGPWITDAAEMWKKTPLRRLMKMAPLTIEVASKLDELDPEVPGGHPAAAPADDRQAALQGALQRALEAEYGSAPATINVGPGQPGQGDPAAASGAGAPAAAAAPGDPPAAAPVAAAGSPAACGAVHAGLGVGPCVLPAHHQREMYEAHGMTLPPQQEHEEAGGTRWTQPR